MRFRSQPALCFDDVLLVPQASDIESRANIDLTTKLGGLELQLPIVSAPMDTVTEDRMAIAMGSMGGAGMLHRFAEPSQQLQWAFNIKDAGYPVVVSIGASEQSSTKILHKLDGEALNAVCIDVAHGDTQLVLDMVKIIRQEFPHLDIIAGSIATGEAAERLVDAGANILRCGVGGGCFKAGTRILMSNGLYKNIEEIKSGDYIINMNGQPAMVRKAFCTGKKEVIGIRNSIWGDFTFVTPDHKYFIGDLSTVKKSAISSAGYVKTLSRSSGNRWNKISKLKWRAIGEREHHTFLMPRNIKFELPNSFNIKLQKRIGGNWRTGAKHGVDTTLIPSYEVGYIFGTFLGDGHANCPFNKQRNGYQGSVRWHYGLDEMHIARKTAECIKYTINQTSQIKITDNTIDVILYYKPLADFLHQFGKKTNKHLPAQYLVNNTKYLQGLYDGLIDSDGSFANTKELRDQFCNTSLQLTELFGVITYLLTGVWPNVQYREPNIGGLKNYSIENCNPSKVSRVLSTGYKGLLNKYQISKLLEKTETLEKCFVYDLEIDCPTHSFIANNAIVHNSLCTTRVQTGHGLPTFQTILEVHRQLILMGVRDQVGLLGDGGIRFASDIVKSLAAGADAVCVGSLLAGTDEAAGDKIVENGRVYKAYRGMASLAIQKEKTPHKTPKVEGVSTIVPYIGPMCNVIDSLKAGIRSGFSYSGAHNIQQLRDRAEFVQVTNNTLKESHAHNPYNQDIL